MAYTPTEWKSGDVITAEKLNNIEEGLMNTGDNNGIMIIHKTMPDPYTTKLVENFDEVKSAIINGREVYADFGDFVLCKVAIVSESLHTYSITPTSQTRVSVFRYVISTDGTITVESWE